MSAVDCLTLESSLPEARYSSFPLMSTVCACCKQNTPKDPHALILGACDCVPLHGKEALWIGLRLRTLRWGTVLDNPGEPRIITQALRSWEPPGYREPRVQHGKDSASHCWLCRCIMGPPAMESVASGSWHGQGGGFSSRGSKRSAFDLAQWDLCWTSVSLKTIKLCCVKPKAC